MKRVKRAVGYVCEIPIPGTDEVISKEDQRIRMMKFAQKEGIELVCVYEDETYTEDFTNRPGIRKAVETLEPTDVLLVERVWAVSRKRKEIEPFLKRLDRQNVQLVASSYLWDCVSQQVRHRYAGKLADRARKLARERAEAKHLKVVA